MNATKKPRLSGSRYSRKTLSSFNLSILRDRNQLSGISTQIVQAPQPSGQVFRSPGSQKSDGRSRQEHVTKAMDEGAVGVVLVVLDVTNAPSSSPEPTKTKNTTTDNIFFISLASSFLQKFASWHTVKLCGPLVIASASKQTK